MRKIIMSIRWQRIISGIIVCSVSIAAITQLRLLLIPYLADSMPLTLYLVAILVTSLVYGTFAGIGTTLFSLYVSHTLFFTPKHGPLAIVEVSTFLRIVIFVLVGFVFTYVGSVSRSYRRRVKRLLWESERHLEHERDLREQIEARQEDTIRMLATLETNKLELEANHARLGRIAKATGIGLWHHNLVLNKQIWTDECKKHFWLGAEDPIDAENVRSNIHQDDIIAVNEYYLKALEGRKVYEIELRTLHPDDPNRMKWIRTNGWVFYKEGIPHQFDGICVDVTEQKVAIMEKEEAKRIAELADEAKSRFLSQMSHEIRSPLNAILGFTHLLQDNLEDERPEGRKLLERIRVNGHHLLHIIDDILDLSKCEAGKIMLEEMPTSPASLIEQVVASLQATAASKDLAIEVEISQTVPLFVQMDPTRVKQILTNLIDNAIKFTVRGTITIRVQTSPYFFEPSLRIEVEDTGIGLDPEYASRLFAPFDREPKPLKATAYSGLGLLVSKRLAQALGGDLMLVRTAPGVGSCFALTIRLQREPPSSRPLTRPCQPLSLEGLKVLLAEDSPDGAAVVSRILTKAKAEVVHATNGYEVLDQVTSQIFDLILMDIQMPGMDGLEATSTLRGRGYDIPILALTAHALPEEKTRSFQAGCNAHLTKPIDKGVLLKAIQEHAGRSM